MAAPTWRLRNIQPIIGCLPMISVAIGVFVICILYSVALSFTGSRLFPRWEFVGLMQYERLWETPRWLISVQNIWLYGVGVIGLNLVFGYLLAVFMDQRIRQEDLLRSIFLYPFALSLIVTGLVWQWMLDPNHGLQAAAAAWGMDWFRFAPLASPSTAIYGVIIAGVWQGTGVTMAILLAGLRGVDAEILKAARVDGIPNWRTYLFIVLPMIKGALATAFVLQAVAVVRVYDLIIAMTQGGPGIATQMPAVFVIEHITNRQNVGVGMAAATMMLMPILILIALRILFQWNSGRKLRKLQRDALAAGVGS